MGILFESLRRLSSVTPNELAQTDPTMIEAITHLENLADALCQLKGTTQGAGDYSKYIQPLLEIENKSKANPKSWRIVVDMAIENRVYTRDPNIQICSGPPSYHRFIMNFEKEGVKTTVESDCVVKKPNLNVIQSRNSPGWVTKSLQEIKNFYDAAHIQRIAILGSSRVFAHPELIDPENPEIGQRPPEDKHYWAQNYNAHIEEQLNRFLDAMEKTENNFLTINGGWAGQQENSTGVPLISSLIGAVSDAHHAYALPPITVMPSVGVFDRVTTRADVYRTASHLPIEELNQEIHTFFEVPGGWGDDSKYLAGLSTGLLVFEPYGFWTNIEIANGVAQDKPVAIIADPKNLEPGKAYYEAMRNGERYTEIQIPLANDQTGSYRVYRDAGEAAQWINEQSIKKMQETASSVDKTVEPELTSSMRSKLEEIKPKAEPDELRIKK